MDTIFGRFGEAKRRFLTCFVTTFSFCVKKRERLKTIIFAIPEGLSRVSEDRKIHEQYLKNRLKIEARDGAPFGIDFASMLMDFGSLVGPQDGIKIA